MKIFPRCRRPIAQVSFLINNDLESLSQLMTVILRVRSKVFVLGSRRPSPFSPLPTDY
ncbi:hypothetical protein N44_02036 [Microcystis aeruginosa NIES-44]|uniref:Uncharacterized protein n=1 Tax=Microcystis aeruginosa NIES-44 TaxID=449439 RepID=A0A0A1VUU4_MICAE|nr:hypothetical protein N44_02036 [Microcystis aeruginosa NIES-44]